jgi:hypothetical protein
MATKVNFDHNYSIFVNENSIEHEVFIAYEKLENKYKVLRK